MISFRCDQCKATLTVADDKAGKKAFCAQCRQTVLAPIAAGTSNPFAELTADAGPVFSSTVQHLYVQNSGGEHQCDRCGSKKHLRRFECYPYKESVPKAVRVDIPGQPFPMWLPAVTDVKRMTGHACKECASKKQKKAAIFLVFLTILFFAFAVASTVYCRSVRDGSENLATLLAFLGFLGGGFSGFSLLRRLAVFDDSGAEVVAEAIADKLREDGYVGVCSLVGWKTMDPKQKPSFFVGETVKVVSERSKQVTDPREIKRVIWNTDAQEYLYVLGGVSEEGWLFVGNELKRQY